MRKRNADVYLVNCKIASCIDLRLDDIGHHDVGTSKTMLSTGKVELYRKPEVFKIKRDKKGIVLNIQHIDKGSGPTVGNRISLIENARLITHSIREFVE